MKHLWFYSLVSVLSLTLCASLRAENPSELQSENFYRETIKPLLQNYCADCHGPDYAEGDLDFSQFTTLQTVQEHGEKWEHIARMIEFGAMPPEDSAQFTEEEKSLVLKWIEGQSTTANCSLNPDPGRVTIRRLNRAEYDNTVRDLIGMDLRLAEDFPSDDVGYGFDNIGDVLSLPPLLFEKYLTAAEKIAYRAIVAPNPEAFRIQHHAGEKLSKHYNAYFDKSTDSFVLRDQGKIVTKFSAGQSGVYQIKISATQWEKLGKPVEMELLVDGKQKWLFTVNPVRPYFQSYRLPLPLKQGEHVITLQIEQELAKEMRKQRGFRLHIKGVELTGPTAVLPEEQTAFQKNLIKHRPEKNRSVEQAAAMNLKPFLRKAFRRTVTMDEVNRFARLAEAASLQGAGFTEAMQVALTGVFVSPHFLFRVEHDQDPNNPDATHFLSDFEMASRLSYFLWSSMPDETLLKLAEQGKLQDENVLRHQVKRMLKDPKSKALSDNFAAQWLNLRSLEAFSPDPERFPTVDAELLQAMQMETLKMFETVIHEDLSIQTFIDARFSFMNEKLAKHYGMPGVKGNQFRKVALKDPHRQGILTHASILTLTSNPTRTSPVQRGKWIMENILGVSPPEAPPNVPALEEAQASNPNASLREQLELHRQNAVCASCHRQMDALGFGFENYDVVGRWRDQDGKHPVDPSGVLPTGEAFQNSEELIDILSNRQQEFAYALTEKMLTYAIGRGLETFDRCAIEEIVSHLETQNYQLSALISEVVLSEPFRQRRGDGGSL
ncbi:Planctomycete cytochrome C [Planctomycetales bacterium 10988]|nr:Planctomycete cytochrome C [Planctomycetales bacterium 10988]